MTAALNAPSTCGDLFAHEAAHCFDIGLGRRCQFWGRNPSTVGASEGVIHADCIPHQACLCAAMVPTAGHEATLKAVPHPDRSGSRAVWCPVLFRARFAAAARSRGLGARKREKTCRGADVGAGPLLTCSSCDLASLTRASRGRRGGRDGLARGGCEKPPLEPLY